MFRQLIGIMQRSPSLAAIAVVLRDNRVLLARRGKSPDKGLWGYPGGHVEWGETALAAAARELREETGVVARPEGYLTNVDVLRRGADGTAQAHFLLAAVRCTYVSGTARAADDVTAVQWADFSDVETGALGMSDQVAEILALARRYHDR